MYSLNSFFLTLISTLLAMFSCIFGSSFVLLSKKSLSKKLYKIFLGLTAGMISSSVISLLLPSISMLYSIKDVFYILIGLFMGAFFLKSIDKLITSLNGFNIRSSLKRKLMIVVSSSFRNLIEGISIGIAYSLVDLDNTLSSAIILSISLILQNILESFSLSISLKDEFSSLKSFFFSSVTGVFEPIGGVIGIILCNKLISILPLILSISSGIIITVVIGEMIPECLQGSFKKCASIGFAIGFSILIILEFIL